MELYFAVSPGTYNHVWHSRVLANVCCVFKVVDLNYFSSLCFMLFIYHTGDNTMHI